MKLGKKTLVSVIIASYNHKDFVREAINSVLNQTVKDIEVIVVDDGSTDGTDKVIQKFSDERIKFTRLSDNRRSHPRNLALRFAKGRYIAFQNSDDVWQKNKLELQLKAFKDNKNLTACFTAVEIIVKSGLPSNKTWAKNLFTTVNKSSDEWLRYFFDIGNCLCISSAVVSRKTLKKVGFFDESLVQLSDLDLWIRCASVGNLHILDKPLTKMRIVRNKNISAPSPQTYRRANLEYAHVLERFTDKKSRVNIPETFPDVCPAVEHQILIQKVHLVQYAWAKSPSHRLFADRLFESLVANTKQRNIITNHFGPGIFLDFLKKRSELEIIVHG